MINRIPILHKTVRSLRNSYIEKKKEIERSDIWLIYKAFNLNNLGVEIGVQEGKHAKDILNNWNGKHLYLIDLWAKNVNIHQKENVDDYIHERNLIKTVKMSNQFKKRTTIIKSDSVKAASLFKDRSLDWIYIDAGHTFEEVWNDLHAWLPKVKINGVVSGHDYLLPDVRSVVDSYFYDVKLMSDNNTWWWMKN